MNSNAEEERMVYVAVDPTQPGAAYACCMDDPRWVKDTAKDIAEWVRKGAIIMRVTPEIAREMLGKWVRPENPKQETLP